MFADLLRSLTRGARGFAHNRGGNVALIFALCLIPVILFIGAAADLANAQRIRQQLQDATDSAVLAVARDGLSLTDAQLKPEADAYIKASYDYKRFPYTITTLTFDRTTVTATLKTKATVPTSFMQLAGIRTVPISADAISKGLGFEIAMVLDTSTSMSESAGSGGSKISALRTAASTFLTSMFGTQTTSQRVSIGIVPFATSVRVMPAGTTVAPSWLDTTGAATNASEDLDVKTVSKWSLFSTMKNTTWGGCVMTRAAPYDVDDTAPAGATLFEPWFAPDEPDTSYGSGRNLTPYPNNYLSDTGGNCSGSSGLTDPVRQQRTCKYKNVKPSGDGPNFYCNSPAITPLTNTKATLDNAVSALQANGNTNILEGMMWGWRVLSPTEPFTQGKAYNAANNRKVMILMTDGQNNYGGTTTANFNYGTFFSYGYAVHGHLQKTADNDTLNAALDAKTVTACANAKAKGIIIYTIGFGSGANVSQNLLRTCASQPSYFYQPQNSSDLQPVFLAIAESINQLRIAQ